MRQTNGNLWDFHEQGNWICITTNGSIRKDGCAVMGRGVALQAAQKLPELQYKLGQFLLEWGNHVFTFPEWRIVTFPVKHKWNDQRADLNLIRRSTGELIGKWIHNIHPNPIYLPRPGCGNGNLSWIQVQPMLNQILGRDFIVVNYDEGN